MIPPSEQRPDPDSLLRLLKKEEEKESRGRLKIFFGMCAGVGKTYEMLQAAHEAKKKGIDVVVGYVETHGRAETEALVAGLTVLPRKVMEYRGVSLEEMDLDAILARKPRLVLADELAHTNAPGSRHTKRYLDVMELLDNGIDVYTTLNVQHLESRADMVAQFTGAIVRETVPDSVFERADEVEVIDLPPDELLKRLAEGKVYSAERSQRAVQSFFRIGNLTALREMALRLGAERVDRQLRDYMQTERISGPWKSGHRLVVGITANPRAIQLIRWTRRIAFAMQAKWIGVFVEQSKQLTDAEKSQLAKNLDLARELGAEIVTTADEDVSAALVRVAREQNATQIIVGRSSRPWFWRMSLVDRLLELSKDIDVHVASGEEPQEGAARWRIAVPEIHSGIPQYAVAAAIVLILSGLCYPFTDLLGYQTVSLILLLAVVLLPLRFGVGPVILAAVMSVMTWDYFFIPPRYTFVIATKQDLLMVLTYFAIAAVTGTLTVRVRTREKAVRSREERAVALYALTHDLSVAKNQDDVIRAAVLNIKKFFGADVAAFVSDLDGDFVNKTHPASTYTPNEKELSVPAWVHWNEKKAGRFTETLPFAEATYFPLSSLRYPLGVIGVRTGRKERLSIDQETLLENFLTQISSVLEREFLNEMTKQSIAFVESERLYTTLFNSISHEMRTPITALVGASESLLNDSVGGQPEVRKELAQEIQSASERLDNIVQNLLAMTRLESGLIQPHKDWTDFRDMVHSCRSKLQKELAQHHLVLDIPASLPLLRLDYALFEQVLLNILRNAAHHTPPGTTVKVRAEVEQQECVVTISDDGPGFPAESLKRVFEKFYRVPGSRTGGIGLGLSIARGFVMAHGGTLTAENLPEGGAKFTIRLPIQTNGQSSTGATDE
ncbi:MAG TPA: sensor histidine kinase KdpD [Bacteroidota bacterium]|nr:sensor histidine kinase KdpD [Bacteroidota bacterium]